MIIMMINFLIELNNSIKKIKQNMIFIHMCDILYLFR